MPTPPPFHIAVMQPEGYIHSLGLVDPARYVRYQLCRLGAQVTLAKNRLREDAVNIVFGAHLGFPPELRQRHTCIFFNLEQLGEGGARVSPHYLELLRKSAVIDYDPDNVDSYREDPRRGVVVPIVHAPYLDRGDGIALEERPIDLLFFGSMNERRAALLQRIEACGTMVSIFDHVLYGPERDQFIRQAKAVVNCHFYDASRFEQVRAAHCLSLGTPVISERRERTRPAPAFEDAVSWFGDDDLEDFFCNRFRSGEFLAAARLQLQRFRAHDPSESYRQMLRFATEVHRRQLAGTDRGTGLPIRLALGAGNRYRPGWLNADVVEASDPDVILDLGTPLQLPLELRTRRGGGVRLQCGQLQRLACDDAPARVADLGALMRNALALLAVGGEFEAIVPCAGDGGRRLRADHRRSLDEACWAEFVERFWQSDWFDHRFERVRADGLDEHAQPCAREHAVLLRIVLRKVETTPYERTVARAMAVDFGQFDDEAAAAAERLAA